MKWTETEFMRREQYEETIINIDHFFDCNALCAGHGGRRICVDF